MTRATGSSGCSVRRAGLETAGSASSAHSAPASGPPLPGGSDMLMPPSLFSLAGSCLASLTHNRSQEKENHTPAELKPFQSTVTLLLLIYLFKVMTGFCH